MLPQGSTVLGSNLGIALRFGSVSLYETVTSVWIWSCCILGVGVQERGIMKVEPFPGLPWAAIRRKRCVFNGCLSKWNHSWSSDVFAPKSGYPTVEQHCLSLLEQTYHPIPSGMSLDHSEDLICFWWFGVRTIIPKVIMRKYRLLI